MYDAFATKFSIMFVEERTQEILEMHRKGELRDAKVVENIPKIQII